MHRLSTGVALAALALPAPAAAEDVSSLVEKTLAIHGGREHLAAFSGFRARGRIHSTVDGLSGTVRISVSLDGSMRAEIRYPSRTEIRILAGTLAWDGGRQQQTLSSAEMAVSMRLQYHRLAAPFELATMDPAVLEDAGTSEEGWRLLRREWPDGSRTIYAIDPETGRIPRITGVMRLDDDELVFENESHDFEEVEGVLFPFRTITMVAGRSAAETILDRLERADAFPPDEFLPAGAGGDL